MYRPSRIDTYDSTGESDRPENEVMSAFRGAASSKCTCLSAPVDTMTGADGVESASFSFSPQGFCHDSTDAASKFDEVGVCIMVGVDGAIQLSVRTVRGREQANSRPRQRSQLTRYTPGCVPFALFTVSLEVHAVVKCLLLLQ